MNSNDDDPVGLRAGIQPNRDLLVSFVEGATSANSFETKFQRQYLGDGTPRAPEAFKVVDRFFAEIDDYVDDPS